MTLSGVTDTQYEYIGVASIDGAVMGKDSTTPLGFYGHAPIARTAFSAAALATTTTYDSTQATAMIALVNEIRAALVAVGLKA